MYRDESAPQYADFKRVRAVRLALLEAGQERRYLTDANPV
jgi:hypothetical protein